MINPRRVGDHGPSVPLAEYERAVDVGARLCAEAEAQNTLLRGKVERLEAENRRLRRELVDAQRHASSAQSHSNPFGVVLWFAVVAMFAYAAWIIVPR